jgi:conjugative relaxase-like TrwC/TraI family protein
MLGIRRVGRDRTDYYLSDLGRELPLGASPDRPGRWIGTAGVALGLTGPLEPSGFRALLEGRHPRTGRPMPSAPVSVCGFDLTFSAPKSVSVLFALGGEEVARRVVDAHGGAVESAVRYLECHAVSATRRDGTTREVVATSGLIGGLFTHAVNRNLDPHLHSHVVVANLVHGVDGRWSACDWRGLAAHRAAAAAVYEAHVRAGLMADLGVRWHGRGAPTAAGVMDAPPARPAEIVGVTPELLGVFSSRHAEIRQRVHEVGAQTARGRHVAWAATRESKASAPYEVLVGEWQRRAGVVGELSELSELGHGYLDRLSTRTGVGLRPAVLDEHRYAAVLSITPHGGARRRDVVVAFGAAASDGMDAVSLNHLVSHWVPSNGSVGVAEPLHARSAVVPANHLLRALGPRPTDAATHDVWVEAAHAIDAYRERWCVDDRADRTAGADRADRFDRTGHVDGAGRPDGPDRASEPLEPGTNLASLSAARLADYVRTTRLLDTARARLGVRAPIGVELGIGL